MLAQIQATYPQDVRVIYRHFPLTSIHDKAALSTQAAEAAGRQSAFWEMHDLLFEQQSEWAGMSVEDFRAWVIEQAGELGLDEAQFTEDLDSQELVDQAQEAWERNAEIGLPGTPFLLVNDDIWPNNLPMSKDNIQAIVELILLEQEQYTECPPMVIDPASQYIATLKTAKGDIVIELYPDKAPLAVNNFVFLARDGWYNGVTFHRVLPGFMAQAGDPSGTGYGAPGYAFTNELSDLKFDEVGVVAMANAGPDSNGSQFFITYGPATHLDGGYTIFGQVIAGLEVVESLAPRNPADGLGQPPGDAIVEVVIAEK